MRRRLLLAAVTAGAVALGPAAPALAATTGPVDGFDVSFPQGRALPGSPGGLAIVGLTRGVNDGSPATANPFLEDQLAWAAAAPRVDVYLNTQHPDPAEAVWWPSGDTARHGAAVRSPYGACAPAARASRACAYVYGWSVANDDLATALPVLARHGVVPGRWWLDVEGIRGRRGGAHGNDWSTSRLRNRAVLEGITARLQQDARRVGVYSTRTQLADIAGTPPTSSVLSPLPSWRSGAKDRAAARHLCAGTPLLGGRLAATQWIGDDGFDHVVDCATFASAPRPRITGSRSVGRAAVAKAGTWSAHPRLAYRWTRDGKPIAGATHRTHRIAAKDAGHLIRVVVTAKRDGWSRTVRTSPAVRAAR